MAKQHIGALLVSDMDNVQWLTGFTGTFGAVILTESLGEFITDSRYTLQAREQVEGLEVFTFGSPMTSAEFLAERLLKMEIGQVSFERSISFDTWENWKSKMAGVQLAPAPDLITPLRMIKTPEEIAKIRNACALADACLVHIERMIQIGVAEYDIGLEIEFFFRRNKAEIAFPPIVASGENSARPHARATERKLQRGDFLTLDFGCKLDGYNSDITRTFVIGEASDRHKAVYERVLEAQKASIDAIRPGANGKDIDRLARDILNKDDLAQYFGHGLGHGLGKTVHDSGRLNATTNVRIEPGQVWTVEPGVYIEGFGGVRIEDDVAVNEQGVEVLTKSPKSLKILG